MPIRYSNYLTEIALKAYAEEEGGWDRCVKYLRDCRADGALVEVWGDGSATDEDVVRQARETLAAAGMRGIGVIFPSREQDTGEHDLDTGDNEYGGNSRWGGDLCYTRQESRDAMADASRLAAKYFDTLIIDDALCTQCTCKRCRLYREGRSWSQYRRDQLLDVSRVDIIGAARAVDPDIEVIIKFPQWYDRLHLFGYDTERQTELYDATWIGNETRDPETPEFGFVPQYESFFNTQWHMRGGKLSGGWFDPLDCDEKVYVEQARQAVIGGARDFVLFSDTEERMRGGFIAALNREQPDLDALAERLDGQELEGIVAIRPHNADPHGDGYLFDGLGMIGFPLNPHSQWPTEPPLSMLVTGHLAGNEHLTRLVEQVIEESGTVFMTASVLAKNVDNDELMWLAGYHEDGWCDSVTWQADEFTVDGETVHAERPIPMRYDLRPHTAFPVVTASAVAHHRSVQIPVMTWQGHPSGGAVVVLNVHGLDDSDFVIHENLNVARPLDIMDLPEAVINAMQAQVIRSTRLGFVAPSRVSVHPFSGGDVVIENFNDREIVATAPDRPRLNGARVVLGNGTVRRADGNVEVTVPARSLVVLGTM